MSKDAKTVTLDRETIPAEAVEAAARALAMLEPGEEWPTNEALGGSLTGTRDDEYRREMFDQARDALAAALPHIREQIARDIEAHVSTEPTLMHVVDWTDGMETAAAITRGGAA